MILALQPSNPFHAREAFPPYDNPRPSHHRSEDSIASTDSYAMSTSHRGLPPPASMTLPDPVRPIQQSLGSMPAPPGQWHGAEESMRNWLVTKAEEERRKQEEERTRQETLRLEQRRVEQAILRESMQGGVPPQMIPIIFAGLGGQAMGSASAEWLQQYTAQLQESMARAHERREPPFAHPIPPSTQQFPAYAAVPGPPPTGPTSAPRSAVSLSRLNTVDLNPSSAPPQEQNTSPSVQFHHWMPPATQETKGHLPPTPIGREPTSAHTTGDQEYHSPRKRKATGGHQAQPGPSQISPSLINQANHQRSQQQTHVRTRSNKSDEQAERRDIARRDSVAASSRPDEHRFARDAGWSGPPQASRPHQGSPRHDTR